MNINDLRQANEFALKYGVKGLIYGPPGSAKTPLVNTAPRPLLLACEPGLLSMRGSQVPTYQAFTSNLVDEFFKWFFNSNESRNFDTLAVDSVSQMCDIYLQAAHKTNKHGLAAYGEMARNVMDQLRPLFFMQQKHTYLIAKQATQNENGILKCIPYFPGQQLPVDIPHMYDEVLHLTKQNVPMVGTVTAFRCIGVPDVLARDRSGRLNEFEPPDYAAIVRKAMS